MKMLALTGVVPAVVHEGEFKNCEPTSLQRQRQQPGAQATHDARGAYPSKLRDGLAPHITRSDAEQLFESCGFSVDELVHRDELQRRLSEKKLPAHVNAGVAVALTTADCSLSGKMGVEDFRQGLMLGTEPSAEVLCSRRRGQNPLSGPWVERSRLLAHLQHRLAARDGCTSLPGTLCLFVVVFILVVLHFQEPMSHELRVAADSGLKLPDFLDDYPASVWGWLSNRAGVGALAPHVAMVGGIRLGRLAEAQVFPQPVLCEHTRETFVYDALTCLVQTRHNCRDARPSFCQDASVGRLWLHTVLEIETAMAVLQDTRVAWENASSMPGTAGLQGLVLQLIAHNEQLNFYMLYNVAVHFDSSGLLQLTEGSAFVDANPIWMGPFTNSGSGAARRILVICDILFLLTCWPLLELIRLMRSCRRAGCRSGIKQHMGLWNIAAWLNLAMGSVAIAQFAYCEHLIQGLNQLIGDLPVLGGERLYTESEFNQILSISNVTLQHYEAQLDGLLEQAGHVGTAWNQLCWYGMVMLCASSFRFSGALQANLRLEILVDTIKQSFVDFAHLLLVFTPAAWVFVLIGYMTFGSRLEIFSSVDRAFASTMLLLGRYQYDEVHEDMCAVGGVLGVLWIVALNVVLALIFIPLVLAVLFGVYTQLRRDAGDAPGMWQQAWGAVTRQRDGAKGLPRGAEAVDKQDHIWPSDFPPRAAAEGSPPEQAAADWSERRLNDALMRRGPRLEGWVSSAALAEELGARGPAARLVLDGILRDAAEGRGGLGRGGCATVSVKDSLRCLDRLDANTRDVLEELRGILELRRSSDGAAGVVVSPEQKASPAELHLLRFHAVDLLHRWGSQNLQTAADLRTAIVQEQRLTLQSSCLIIDGKTVNDDELLDDLFAGMEMQGLVVTLAHHGAKESPSGDLTSSAVANKLAAPLHGGQADEAMVELLHERMSELERSDAERCEELGRYVQSLIQRVEELERQRIQSVEGRVRKLLYLEEKVSKLVAGVQPIFEGTSPMDVLVSG